MPSGCTFPLKYKKSQITKSPGSNYLALGSIVIIDSFLHLLQYPGKFLRLVSFRYFIIFGYPHLGHLYQYSFVDICSPLSLSISHCPEYSNNFMCFYCLRPVKVTAALYHSQPVIFRAYSHLVGKLVVFLHLLLYL